MKILKYAPVFFLSVTLVSCGGQSAEDKLKDELTDALNDLNETSSNTEWRTISTNSFYDVDIPSRMEIATDLNADASTQYQYAEQVGSEVKEHYMIVLMETMEEIESYDLGMDFDAMSYGEIAVTSLEGGLDAYEILTKEPAVETINGMDAVVYEMEGALGAVDVYYMLGVFQGEKAFYQVLTWTIKGQKGEFKADMEKTIRSFKEK